VLEQSNALADLAEPLDGEPEPGDEKVPFVDGRR